MLVAVMMVVVKLNSAVVHIKDIYQYPSNELVSNNTLYFRLANTDISYIGLTGTQSLTIALHLQ